MYEGHVETCNDNKNSGDTMERALAIAHDLVYKENTVEVYGRMERNPNLAMV